MPKFSAGLLLFRRGGGSLEVFLVHPGGPFWQKKDWGAWSIPKGEYQQGDDPIFAARREFREETGFDLDGDLIGLGTIKQPGGKQVSAWALEGDCSPESLRSNSFSMEWPPKSGQTREFPEVDRGAWFPLEEARRRITQGQAGFLDRLAEEVSAGK